ncbi:PRC-barrel domain-containing protein [Aquibium sp. A9E412]|uniref:PRC-barrel domain-containing protein n=1 Tax=Aquibium sp. A9E412 TaxID=2976767 RepID=UPI0025AF25FA|nr:PRC-barrel domain-containing protein [Aquibium sp. A9E412]MDN2565406.1 PRC-barrel domain-containing protein [Aquibium sp. A9E412]
MMRNLLATTAIATLVATGAVAQTTDPSASTTAPTAQTEGINQAPEMVVRADGHLASNIIGETVYNGTGEGAENIGEVDDIIIGENGDVEAVVIGVGGFLGLGQKKVAIEYDVVKWSELDGERFLVVETTADQLKAQEEFDAAAYEPMPADVEVSETRPASEEDLASAPAEGEQAGDQQADEQMAAEDGAQSDDEMVSAPSDRDAVGDDQQQAADAQQDNAQSQDGEQMAAEDEAAGEQDMAASDEQAADGQASDEMAATDGQATEDGQDGEQMAAEDEAAGEQDMAASDEQAADQQAGEEMAAEDETVIRDEQTAAEAGDEQVGEETTAAIDRDGLSRMETDQIRAEEFIGTTVYGANEDTIGEIGDVLLTADGEIDAIIVDVGGFLGLGEKEVAIGLDNLVFLSDDGGDLYLYTDFTEEQLESQPEFEEDAYADRRDEMRLTIQ